MIGRGIAGGKNLSQIALTLIKLRTMFPNNSEYKEADKNFTSNLSSKNKIIVNSLVKNFSDNSAIKRLGDSGIGVIAEICHNACRTLCKSKADHSLDAWSEASDGIKESSRDGVRAIVIGEVKSPEDSHNNWTRFKGSQGWKYGKEKDAEAKTHPDMISYDELPEYEKLKDKLFFNIVMSFL